MLGCQSLRAPCATRWHGKCCCCCCSYSGVYSCAAIETRLCVLKVLGADVQEAKETLVTAKRAVITDCTAAVIVLLPTLPALPLPVPVLLMPWALSVPGQFCRQAAAFRCYLLITCRPFALGLSLNPWSLGWKTIRGMFYLPQHLGQLALNQTCAPPFSFLFFPRNFFSSEALPSCNASEALET